VPGPTNNRDIRQVNSLDTLLRDKYKHGTKSWKGTTTNISQQSLAYSLLPESTIALLSQLFDSTVKEDGKKQHRFHNSHSAI